MTKPSPDPWGRQLPDGVVATGASPEFDAATLPDKLRREHRLAAGNHGRLVVLAGSMQFVDLTAGAEVREPLAAGQSRVIPPEQPHRVELGPGARFRIDFYRTEAGCS